MERNFKGRNYELSLSGVKFQRWEYQVKSCLHNCGVKKRVLRLELCIWKLLEYRRWLKTLELRNSVEEKKVKSRVLTFRELWHLVLRKMKREEQRCLRGIHLWGR